LASPSHLGGDGRSACPTNPATNCYPWFVTVRQSEMHCRKVTRLRARNFYLGLMLTPQPRRAALYAVYAWMRCADDLADESPGPVTARLRLADFAAKTRETLDIASEPEDAEALWPSFAHTVRHYPLQREWLDQALAGLMADQQGQTIVTTEDLDRYCYQVAGTVGMICTAIWRSGLAEDDAEGKRALELAQLRGRAFQYTNILRDIRDDAQLTPARVYLPRQSFAEFGLNPQELLQWSDPAKCGAMVRFWADEAADLYNQTAELEGLIPQDCRASLLTMTRLYRTLLERIRMEPRGVVANERVRVPLVEKLRILGEQLLQARGGQESSPQLAR